MAVINCKNLTMKFGDKVALDGISFQLGEQSITGFIGRNGSGKTTFMRLASGIIKSTSGELEVMGEVPYGNISIAENVIYSFHNYPHQEQLLLKNIMKEYVELFPEFDKDFASNLLKYYSLDGKMKYKSLSQGMKSMFNFSMALATRSPITFLDEPMLGMDVKTRKHAYEILLTEYTMYPRNFIISSHMLNEFDTILTDIVLIDNGKMVFHKDIDEIPQLAYRVDGDVDTLQEVISDGQVLYAKIGELGSYYIVEGTLTQEIKQEMGMHKLECSVLRPEEVCMYYSSQKEEEDLSCLWNEKN